uniref:Uncharacterized protein n=1 Tax=Strongyloides papillosus TaxID=174720 RepID=A0A0N5BKQ2_STREA
MTLPDIENDEQLQEAFRRRREKLEKIRKVKKIHQYFRDKFNNYIRETYAKTRKDILEGTHPKVVRLMKKCDNRRDKALQQVETLAKLKYDTLKRKHDAEDATIEKRQKEEIAAAVQQELDKLGGEKKALLSMAKSFGMYDIATIFEDNPPIAKSDSEFKDVKPSIKSEVVVKVEARPNNLPFVSPSSSHFLTQLSGLAHLSEDFNTKVDEDIKLMQAHMAASNKK